MSQNRHPTKFFSLKAFSTLSRSGLIAEYVDKPFMMYGMARMSVNYFSVQFTN